LTKTGQETITNQRNSRGYYHTVIIHALRSLLAIAKASVFPDSTQATLALEEIENTWITKRAWSRASTYLPETAPFVYCFR
ncbi:MAG: hypothetical protein PWK00_04215, partial [Coxiella burnetii]|nr:hypothetical protein [Coxiella burnetii]